MLPENSELRRPYKYLRRRTQSQAAQQRHDFQEGLRPKYAYMGVNWYFLKEEPDPLDSALSSSGRQTAMAGAPTSSLEASLQSRRSKVAPDQRPSVNRTTRRERLMHTARATDELLDTMIQRRLQEEIAARSHVRKDEYDASLETSRKTSLDLDNSIQSFGSTLGDEEDHVSETTAELLGLLPGAQGSRQPSEVVNPRGELRPGESSRMESSQGHLGGLQPTPPVTATAHAPAKPDTPLIVWRPSTRVKLAKNVPAELLDSTGPKAEAGRPESPFAGRSSSVVQEKQHTPRETPILRQQSGVTEPSGLDFIDDMRGRHSEGAVREPERVSEVNGNFTPSSGKTRRRRPRIRQPLRLPKQPKPEKLRYGAWYVDPRKWTKGMKEFDRGPPESKEERQRNAEMAALDEKISSISQQLPDLFIANEFKSYAHEKGLRIPDYLEKSTESQGKG
mmetsp:Transcript_38789/g.50136  ORF Transcript_38789/g.50136 Transcript_38789/m.50136 type:complete len:449 (+) Transcript_38789:67-1413(+)